MNVLFSFGLFYGLYTIM